MSVRVDLISGCLDFLFCIYVVVVVVVVLVVGHAHGRAHAEGAKMALILQYPGLIPFGWSGAGWPLLWICINPSDFLFFLKKSK